MRSPIPALLALVSVVLASLTLACRPFPEPGEALGQYTIIGMLRDNTCAPGLDPIDPLEFRVDLWRDRGRLTWRLAGGRPVTGTLRDDGSFHLRTRLPVQAWPADPGQGIVGCTLEQIETIEGTIVLPASSGDAAVASKNGEDPADAGVGRPSTLTGENRIEIVPVAGSDCSPLLLSFGGSFPSLPCAARYVLTGTRTGS
jgi:hypothetical protein